MKTGLFWNTYRGDFEWYRISARSYKKFASGFQRARCLVPHQDFEQFRQFNEPLGIETVGHTDAPGKGFLKHMIVHCWADNLMPDCAWIGHIDADCVFAKPSTPETWQDACGRFYMITRLFSELLIEPIKPGEEIAFMGADGLRSEMNRGQLMWKWTTEFALGWTPQFETMQAMPLFFPREAYARLREVMNARHGNWEGYILSCRNEFPQTFCEFNALGEIARTFFRELYHWWHLKNPTFDCYPSCRGNVIQSWSHGGFDRVHDFSSDGGRIESPRQMFARLGLI